MTLVTFAIFQMLTLCQNKNILLLFEHPLHTVSKYTIQLYIISNCEGKIMENKISKCSKMFWLETYKNNSNEQERLMR